MRKHSCPQRLLTKPAGQLLPMLPLTAKLASQVTTHIHACIGHFQHLRRHQLRTLMLTPVRPVLLRAPPTWRYAASQRSRVADPGASETSMFQSAGGVILPGSGIPLGGAEASLALAAVAGGGPSLSRSGSGSLWAIERASSSISPDPLEPAPPWAAAGRELRKGRPLARRSSAVLGLS